MRICRESDKFVKYASNQMKRPLLYAIFTAAVLAAASCSTTRVLQDGEYRLVENSIIIENGGKLNPNKLLPYVKQKSKTWSPMMCVYNWSGKDTQSSWSRFVRKIGVAPVVYNPDMVASSVENIKRHLKYIGYFNSGVDAKVEVKRQKVKVKYYIKPGKRYPITSVNYFLPKDNPVFKEDFIRDTAHISVKKGDFLAESMLEAESVRSTAYFRQLGYYSLSKNHYFFQADTLSKPGSAILDMRINGYTRNESPEDAINFQRYKFGKVDIFYPKSLKIRKNILYHLNMIRPGEPYSEEAVNNTYNRLSALRMLSSVNIELFDTDSAKVDCEIHLAPSKLQGFKLNMEASSNSTGLFGLSPEVSFYHKNIFRGGEWLNLGFMGNYQFKPKENVRSTEFGVSAGLSFPKFLFLPYSFFKKAIPRTDIKASYNYQNRPEYRRNIISTSFGYAGVNKKLYYQLYPLQLNIVHLFNIDENFYSSLSNNPFMRNAYQDHFDLGLGGLLYYTTNSSVNPKTTYHYFSLQFNLAGNLLSLFKPLMDKDKAGAGMIWNTPFSQYVRGEFTAGKTWRFGKEDKQSFATRFVIGAGHAYGNSTVLPFEQHFYGGGANSLRGWQARGVGPGLSKMESTFVIPNQTGDMRIEANFEYRFPLFWKVEGAAFIDVGNIWTLRESTYKDNDLAMISKKTLIRGLASDWGLGIRVDLDFILIRLDMGMQVYDPSSDPGQRWVSPNQWLKSRNAVHFGVGYPF